ncbi:hypothetical protein, partial [Listeria costaricensis]|uniref:hypothetical protein n=1 Tax=Listeria costaricensis TaxID=2026604 RepID=UPI001968BBBE
VGSQRKQLEANLFFRERRRIWQKKLDKTKKEAKTKRNPFEEMASILAFSFFYFPIMALCVNFPSHHNAFNKSNCA